MTGSMPPERPQAIPPPPPPAYPPQQLVYVQQPSNGIAVGALVCGIVGTVLGLIPILFFIAWALGITAFVLGLVARRKARELGGLRKTMAAWGVALGVVSFGMGIVGIAIIDDIFDDTEQELEQIDRELQQDLDDLDSP